jgi:hypothetical protein
MAIKQCKLVIVKRTRKCVVNGKEIVEESFLKTLSPSEWRWMKYKSEAELFNRRDAEKDLMPKLQELESQMRAAIGQATPLEIAAADAWPAEYELVELIEKKSFGWVIKQMFPESGDAWVARIHQVDISQEPVFDLDLRWANSQHNAILMPEDLKDILMSKLKEKWPDSKFEAVELFSE